MVAVIFGSALIQFGHRPVASLCLYGCALTLALPAVRITAWMTVSDALILLAAAFLIPEIPTIRVRSRPERSFAFAVVLIVVGGLLGTLGSEAVRLELAQIIRLAVAAGATLVVFALWAPSTAELRCVFALVVLSGLVTGVWAITHASSNFGRPSGLSGHPNHLALVSMISAGPAIAFWIVPGSRRALRLAAGGATAILVAAITISGSRAGLVGLALEVIVAAVLARNSEMRMRLAVYVVSLAVAAVVGFSTLTSENAIARTFSPQSLTARASDQERRAAFSAMADEIEREPLTGVGFSNPLGGHDAYLQLWAAGESSHLPADFWFGVAPRQFARGGFPPRTSITADRGHCLPARSA